MRKTLIAACALVLIVLAPGTVFAWGFVGHKLIMRRAIELLPPEIKPFFDHYRDEIVMRAIDPDLWRNVGWDDDPNHFLDFGVDEYGVYPFSALPRDYGAALERFGERTLTRYGLLPWREAEQFGNLRRGFEGFKRASPYSTTDVVLFSATAAHYLQDAHMPFHASNNYDGELTGNHGIHARFERDLVERFESRLKLTPSPITPVANMRDASFDALLASFLLVEPILKADTEAIAGKDTYDDDYFEQFFVKVQPILERQLSESITATASMIVAAWDQAGRPAVRLSDVRPLEKVRTPR